MGSKQLLDRCEAEAEKLRADIAARERKVRLRPIAHCSRYKRHTASVTNPGKRGSTHGPDHERRMLQIEGEEELYLNSDTSSVGSVFKVRKAHTSTANRSAHIRTHVCLASQRIRQNTLVLVHALSPESCADTKRRRGAACRASRASCPARTRARAAASRWPAKRSTSSASPLRPLTWCGRPAPRVHDTLYPRQPHRIGAAGVIRSRQNEGAARAVASGAADGGGTGLCRDGWRRLLEAGAAHTFALHVAPWERALSAVVSCGALQLVQSAVCAAGVPLAHSVAATRAFTESGGYHDGSVRALCRCRWAPRRHLVAWPQFAACADTSQIIGTRPCAEFCGTENRDRACSSPRSLMPKSRMRKRLPGGDDRARTALKHRQRC